MESENAESQVQIQLKTKQTQYAVPDVPYTIDGTMTTAQMNTFLNRLLERCVAEASGGSGDHKAIDFDFLVFEEYLRGRLCDHLRDKAISVEDNIEIEYVERFPAPEPQDCLLHDDWVAGVDTCGKWILTGCYDATVNIWDIKGKHVLSIPAHSMPVKSVKWIGIEDGRGSFVTCSQDQTASLWEWVIDSNTVNCIGVCRGHERGVDAIDVSGDRSRFATGSWDLMLKVWSAEREEILANTPKRPKTDDPKIRLPSLTLQGHRECLSAVQWIDNSTILSSSWDHTIKVWDLNLCGVRSEISTNKAIFDASYSDLNRMVVTASADKHVRLYDLRTNQNAVVKNTFLGHEQWVQTVMWSKTEEFLFVSGSYDNASKLWDCRSPKAPLYDLIGHGDKVLDIDWTNPKYIVSGGADNTVRIYKSRKAIAADGKAGAEDE